MCFYDNFVRLCSQKGVSRTRACIDFGVSRTAWHKWEGGTMPNGSTLNKMSEYFDVQVSELLGEEEQKENPQIRQDQEVSESFKELWGMMKDAPEDDLRLLIKMYQAIRSERNKG